MGNPFLFGKINGYSKLIMWKIGDYNDYNYNNYIKIILHYN